MIYAISLKLTQVVGGGVCHCMCQFTHCAGATLGGPSYIGPAANEQACKDACEHPDRGNGVFGKYLSCLSTPNAVCPNCKTSFPLS